MRGSPIWNKAALTGPNLSFTSKYMESKSRWLSLEILNMILQMYVLMEMLSAIL